MKLIKKVNLTTILVFIITGTFAQKVKVKQGEITLDKQLVAKIEKVKLAKDKFYVVSDLKADTICKVKEASINSILFPNHKSYDYKMIYGHEIGDTIVIDERFFYLSEKKIAKHLVDIKLLTTEGLNSEHIPTLVKERGNLPEWIIKEINNESTLISHKDFVVKRFVNDTLLLKAKKPILERGYINRAPSTQTRIDIYQKDQDSEIFIGYAIHEVKEIDATYHYIIFNSKNVPLSSFDGFYYRMYHPYKEYGITEHKLKRLTNRYAIAEKMALDLVGEGKL